MFHVYEGARWAGKEPSYADASSLALELAADQVRLFDRIQHPVDIVQVTDAGSFDEVRTQVGRVELADGAPYVYARMAVAA